MDMKTDILPNDEDKEGYENGYSNNNNYENPKDYQTYPSEYRTQ